MTDEHMPELSDDSLAAEFVLGVLTGADRARALRLQLSDPIFAQEVAAWQSRIAPLYADFPDVSPPESIWDSTVARIGATPVAATGAHWPKPANRIWKPLAIAASLLAASLTTVIIVSRVPSPAPAVVSSPLAVASLTGANSAQMVTVAYDRSVGKLRIASTGLQGPGRAPELWLIPKDGRPRSLGLIRGKGTTQLSLSDGDRALIASGTTLAVTMEKPADAPHKAPGSTPILTGKIAIL